MSVRAVGSHDQAKDSPSEGQNHGLLRLDYESCQAGYNHRDALVPEEFDKLLRSFFGFLALLIALQAFGSFDHTVAVLVNALLSVAGLIALTAILVDIEANASCKRALRERCLALETVLAPGGELEYWSKAIRDRQQYYEERHFKGPISKGLEGSTASGFVNASRLLILLWIVLSIVFIGWGDKLELLGRH